MRDIHVEKIAGTNSTKRAYLRFWKKSETAADGEILLYDESNRYLGSIYDKKDLLSIYKFLKTTLATGCSDVCKANTKK